MREQPGGDPQEAVGVRYDGRRVTSRPRGLQVAYRAPRRAAAAGVGTAGAWTPETPAKHCLGNLNTKF